jgi:hypothetical protein
MSDLKNHVGEIVKRIEQGFDETETNYDGEQMSAFDYLQDALDIEYIVNSKKEYLGARVLVAFGGPNIWINTRTKQVEGAWWGESFTMPYHQDSIGLDEALEELWQC